jgi:hypothetical protein
MAASFGRRLFIRSFLAQFNGTELDAVLPETAAYRLAERELTPAERRAACTARLA